MIVSWAKHPLNIYSIGLLVKMYMFGEIRTTTMIPQTDPAPDTPEDYYQKLHLSTRNVAECCIGVMKARFRCKSKPQLFSSDEESEIDFFDSTRKFGCKQAAQN